MKIKETKILISAKKYFTSKKIRVGGNFIGEGEYPNLKISYVLHAPWPLI